MSRDEKHQNKTNIKSWKLPPQWKDKGEELKTDWASWQDTRERRATSAGEKVDSTCKPKKDKNPKRHAEDTNKKRQRVRTTKTEQNRTTRNGKTHLEKTKILKRKGAQNNLNKDIEAGRTPSGGKRATYMDTTALCMDKDPTEALTALYESLFDVMKENITEAKAAVEFWQNSWKGKERERGMRNFHSSSTKNNQTTEKRRQRRRNHSRNSGSTVSRTNSSTRRKLERKMQELSVRRRSHKNGSSSSIQGDGSTTLGYVQANRMSDNSEKTGGLSLVDDHGKMKCESLQPPATRNIQHLDD